MMIPRDKIIQILEITVGLLPATVLFLIPLSLSFPACVIWLIAPSHHAQIDPFTTSARIMCGLAGLGGLAGLVSLWITAVKRPRTIVNDQWHVGLLSTSLCAGIAAMSFIVIAYIIPDFRKSLPYIGHNEPVRLVFAFLCFFMPVLLALRYLVEFLISRKD